jgi:hypothetical protein
VYYVVVYYVVVYYHEIINTVHQDEGVEMASTQGHKVPSKVLGKKKKKFTSVPAA